MRPPVLPLRYVQGTASSSLLQGHPSSLRFGHPDVATDNTVPFYMRLALLRQVVQ